MCYSLSGEWIEIQGMTRYDCSSPVATAENAMVYLYRPAASNPGLTGDAKWEPTDVSRSLDPKPGERAFLNFKVEYNTSEIGLLEMGPKHIIRLNQVPESDAVYQIRDTTKTKQ